MKNERRLSELTGLDTELKRGMGLFSAVSIIAGIMIGSGIFYIGSFVLQRSNGAPGFSLFVWAAGGAISLLAGLCYAELGAAMPRSGGAYVYLREAYGPMVAFTSGWTSFLVSSSGSISALAVALAEYFSAFWPLSPIQVKLFAVGVIILLTVINCYGIKFGSIVQNAFMIGKLIPILLIAVLGLIMGSAKNPMTMSPVLPGASGSPAGTFAVALVAALWAYEGWTNLNTVAEEIKNPRRNLPLAIIIAITGVTLVYVIFNYALFKVLPVATIVASNPKPGAVAAEKLLGGVGRSVFILGAFISIFGSCNGCVLAFPRYYYAMAKDGLFFGCFGRVHPKYRTPVNALIASGAASVLLVFSGTFSQLTTTVVFASWVYYILTICSLFVLRRKYPGMKRPYKVWGYPALPMIVVAASSFILVNTLTEDPRSSLIGLIVPFAGIPVYYLFKTARERKAVQEAGN